MTLVMVVAMSTATFAWYTANKSVNAQISNITAASAAGDLQISMTVNGQEAGGNAYSQSFAFDAETTTFAPCMPKTLLSEGQTWQQGSLNAVGEWSSSGSTFAGVTGTITLSNKSGDPTGEITATINDPVITSKLVKKDICVAIMKGNTIYASTDYNYGDCTLDIDGEIASAVSAKIPALEGGESVELTFYIWFNGATVVNANMGGSFSIGFEFDAAK